jgi:hypothetical protein
VPPRLPPLFGEPGGFLPGESPDDGDDLVVILAASLLDRVLQHPRRCIRVADQRVLYQVQQVGGALPIGTMGERIEDGPGGARPKRPDPGRVAQLHGLEEDGSRQSGHLDTGGRGHRERQSAQGPPRLLHIRLVDDRGEQGHGHSAQD